MQMDFMDVRLDDKKLPYAVHKAVGEYAGDRGIRIKNPQTAVRVLNEVFHMKDFAEERVYLILMSGSCDVISFAEVGRGVLNCALLGVREILQRALLCNAERLIVAHNHPELGSTPCPSGSDIDLTGSLMRACRLMQVTFSDHIIIAGDQYFSFREEWVRWRRQKAQEEQEGQEARENPKEQKEPENRKGQRAQEEQKKAAETKRMERTGKAEETGKTKRAERTGKTEEAEKTGKAE
ncbi:MAG: hypothetical protein HDR11_11650 [Lachnospiraceae bacterium]|nr:hypothetical protein [Lachnospiraceae bacterium]